MRSIACGCGRILSKVCRIGEVLKKLPCNVTVTGSNATDKEEDKEEEIEREKEERR